MAEEKKKSKTLTTPRGMFIWPSLMTPNTHYKKAGTFGTKLRLSADKAKVVIDMLQDDYDEAVELGQEEFAKQKKAARDKNPFGESPFYSVVYDDNEDPTGEIDFNFSVAAKGKRDDGSIWHSKVSVFDASKKPLPKSAEPSNGSEGKVAFYVKPYFIPATGKAGLSLKIVGAQVLKLVLKGERSADSLGFTDEDGFSVEDMAFEDDIDETVDVDLDDDEEADTDF